MKVKLWENFTAARFERIKKQKKASVKSSFFAPDRFLQACYLSEPALGADARSVWDPHCCVVLVALLAGERRH